MKKKKEDPALTQAKKELQEKSEEIRRLTQERDTIQGRHRFVLSLLKAQAGPLRGPLEPCPNLEVGKFAVGNRIGGKIVWIGKGGGVWAGQELCLLEGHPDAIPTQDLKVLEDK